MAFEQRPGGGEGESIQLLRTFQKEGLAVSCTGFKAGPCLVCWRSNKEATVAKDREKGREIDMRNKRW